MSQLRRALKRLGRLFERKRPGDDPYSYVGAKIKPRPSPRKAAVALEEPR